MPCQYKPNPLRWRMPCSNFKPPMPPTIQTELPIPKPSKLDCSRLVDVLRGRDWRTSKEILFAFGESNSESNRRKVRAMASASAGKVAGGQKGYKLVEEMTREEFQHYRNWMASQAEEMRRRVVLSDHLWFKRKSVTA